MKKTLIVLVLFLSCAASGQYKTLFVLKENMWFAGKHISSTMGTFGTMEKCEEESIRLWREYNKNPNLKVGTGVRYECLKILVKTND